MERDIIGRRYRRVLHHAANAQTDDQRSELTTEARRLWGELDALELLPEPRLLTEDTTPEALVRDLANNDGALALTSDEGTSLFRNAMRNAAEGVSAIEALLKAHSWTTISVNRISRSTLVVPEPALTIAMATQTLAYRKLMGAASISGRGLWERFLFVIPRSLTGGRDPLPPTIDRWNRGQYLGQINSLLALPRVTASDRTTHPIDITMSAEAQQVFRAFVREVDRRMGAGGDLSSEHMTGWAQKIRTNLIRVSGLLHLSKVTSPKDGDPSAVIGADSVEAAVDIMRYCLAHAALALEGIITDDDDLRAALSWLHKNGNPRFLVWRMQYANQSRFRSAEVLRPIVARLEELGAIRKLPQVQGHIGRNLGEYEVSPYVLEGRW